MTFLGRETRSRNRRLLKDLVQAMTMKISGLGAN